MKKLLLVLFALLLFAVTGCKKESINNASGNAPVIVTPNPLCFTAEEAGATVEMQILWYSQLLDTLPNIEYSFDKKTWEEFTIGTTLITLENVGDKVYFRGNNPQGLNPTYDVVQNDTFICFKTNEKKIAASGNVMSLIDIKCEATSVPRYCFVDLFRETSITTPPELPATELAQGCYEGMFAASGLTTAPELPVTTLAEECYAFMFSGCRSLTTAPELPATELANSCYIWMFNGCRSLTIAPELPATTLAGGCYAYMFENCENLTTVNELPATILADGCYYRMFAGCNSLTSTPAILPATTLTTNCYQHMFNGCTSLTTAPELPATTLKADCYSMMFHNCQSLNSIKVNFKTWGSLSETYEWVENVAPSGTFYCPSELPQWFNSYHIPEGWEVVTF